MEMKDILNRMLNHEELSREETRDIIVGITKSEFPEEQITALLTGLQMRGVTVDELLGFRDGILATGVPAILDCDRYIDVVGTGGDRKNTFNISTTSCFVIAGAGYKVAKHGNYAATSVSGASNVIRNHGVQFTDDMDKLNRSINEAGIVYLHAQLFAKAMKFVGPIRKALQFPTVFNLLGPLVNPSQPKCQLLGVANLDQMRNFIFMGSDNDETFLRLVMPGVFDVTEDNRAGVLEATNAVSVSMKVVKATIVNDNVWLSAELLIDSTPVFDDIIPRVLDILLAAQQEFYKQIN